VLPGGQLMLTTEVENYPGFAEPVMGPELMEAFRKQAQRFGTRLVPGRVSRVDFSKRPFTLEVDGKTIQTRTMIISTGASAKWLGIPSEKKYMGKGVSACATCDGFFFRNADIAVVGGGDTALEEATFLTRFAKSVTLIHRRDKLRASKAMQEKAQKNPKIKFLWDTAVEEVVGARHHHHRQLLGFGPGEHVGEGHGLVLLAVDHQAVIGHRQGGVAARAAHLAGGGAQGTDGAPTHFEGAPDGIDVQLMAWKTGARLTFSKSTRLPN
jgi:thioredoxin reductase (NADPH)